LFSVREVGMLNTVIYAVDFGALQPQVLPCLTRLGKAGCRELIMLHVTNEERAVRRAPELLREDLKACLVDAAGRNLDEWVHECSSEEFSVSAEIRDSDPVWLEICEVVRQQDSPLLVLGPKAGAGLGSIAYFIMHSHPGASALLVLKASETEAPGYGESCRGLFSRVLLPTDWSHCALRAEQYLPLLHRAGVGEVVVAHVAEESTTADSARDYEAMANGRLEDSCRAFEKAGLQATSLLLSGDPASAIVEAAAAEQASLIVMGSTGKSVTVDRLIGSVSERVALTSDRSVLLVY
jgi:nucleotide-binding universal stress UspA family protein